jgi:hypothetical protein
VGLSWPSDPIRARTQSAPDDCQTISPEEQADDAAALLTALGASPG